MSILRSVFTLGTLATLRTVTFGGLFTLCGFTSRTPVLCCYVQRSEHADQSNQANRKVSFHKQAFGYALNTPHQAPANYLSRERGFTSLKATIFQLKWDYY
jgi:hypothetical protein